MYDIEVSKEQLLETLQSNRTRHVSEYEEAVRNYPGAVVRALREVAEQIESGEKKPEAHGISMPKPHSYETEYDDAIEMLEWHEGSTVTLDRQQFKQYVQDQWQWSGSFASTTSLYNGR